MMSTRCSKHVEAWNKYIKKECVKLVINQNYLKMHGQQNIKKKNNYHFLPHCIFRHFLPYSGVCRLSCLQTATSTERLGFGTVKLKLKLEATITITLKYHYIIKNKILYLIKFTGLLRCMNWYLTVRFGDRIGPCIQARRKPIMSMDKFINLINWVALQLL
jgi:hypothetical protein